MTLDSTQRLGPFPLGMDNRVPDYQLKLPDDSGHLLRDALNVDIKAYSDAHYKRLCEGSLQPVLDAIKAARETDVWMEITYLVVPGYNDTASLVTNMCQWVVENCGPATPVHFVRFFPRHKHRHW